MATFLDVSVLENFSVIFVFLLAWLGAYATLLYTKVLGDKQFINMILSFVFAFFVILSPLATLIFKSVAPWVAVLMLLVVVISTASGMFGGMHADSLGGLKWIMLVIIVIAFIVGVGSLIRENIDVPERGEDFSKVSTVLFHPNTLGVILIMAIAVFTIGLLASRQM